MDFWSYIYKNITDKRGTNILFGLSRRVREYKIKKTDYTKLPIVKTSIDGKELHIPLAHNLPIYKKKYSNYDRAIKELARLVKKKDGYLRLIDVGANVGDTEINIGVLNDASYLLIEGDELFKSLISENLGDNYDYILDSHFLSDCQEGNFSIVHNMSSASLKENKNNEKNKLFKTLDAVIEEYNFIPNVIKIDTDGFDINVIKGGVRSLSKYKPVIFFEWWVTAIEKNGINPLEVWPILKDIGYTGVFLFDNYGNPLINLEIEKVSQFRDIMNYLNGKNRRFAYCDALVYSKEHELNFDELLSRFE